MTGRPDFDVGDLVECVDLGDIRCRRADHVDPPALRLRATYRVVALFRDRECGCPSVQLQGERNPYDDGFLAARFRKVRKADESFTARIRACRPIKAREDV